MVTTRKKEKQSGKGQAEKDAEPTTSPMHVHDENFVPPKKGGRHALRKRNEPSLEEDNDRVLELLHAISGQLKAKGLDGSGGWTQAGVASALRQALTLLPPALQEALHPDEEETFNGHVNMLLGLLEGPPGKKRPATTKVTKKQLTNKKQTNASCPDTVSDGALEALFSLDTKLPSADVCAAAVMARVPASEVAMRAFCNRKDPGQILRACTATGGLCVGENERVAAFSVLAELVAESGVPEGVVKSAVSCVHTLIASSRSAGSSDVSTQSAWTMWNRGHEDGASVSSRASETCYRLVASLVGRRHCEPLTEDSLGRLVSYAAHLLHLLSPYAAIGLLRHVHKAKAANVGDVAMFMAVLRDGGPTRLDLDAADMSPHVTHAAVYLLYLYLARRAVAAAETASLVTLSHQLLEKASDTTPPASITSWLEDQPPSSTVQLLTEKTGQGLPALSAYLVGEMQEGDLHALASLSLVGIGEEKAAGKAGVLEDRSAMNDLLFFESTEGALNVFPEDWDDEDNVEVAIAEDE